MYILNLALGEVAQRLWARFPRRLAEPALLPGAALLLITSSVLEQGPMERGALEM